jgi:hypothetical protein
MPQQQASFLSAQMKEEPKLVLGKQQARGDYNQEEPELVLPELIQEEPGLVGQLAVVGGEDGADQVVELHIATALVLPSHLAYSLVSSVHHYAH